MFICKASVFMAACIIISGKAIGVSGESKEYAWLEERESKPDDLVVRGAEYRGPKIVGR